MRSVPNGFPKIGTKKNGKNEEWYDVRIQDQIPISPLAFSVDDMLALARVLVGRKKL